MLGILFCTSTATQTMPKRQVFGDELKVKKVYYTKSSEGTNTKGYRAELQNGDEIWADFFVKGPEKGQYICMHVTKCGLFPLKSSTYARLRNLYESQNKLSSSIDETSSKNT